MTSPPAVWTSTLQRTIITASGLHYPKVQWKALDEIQVGAGLWGGRERWKEGMGRGGGREGRRGGGEGRGKGAQPAGERAGVVVRCGDQGRMRALPPSIGQHRIA